MALRSTGICFEIVGTKYSNNGRSCSDHRACGALLHVDAVVSIRDVQIQISDVPELALAAHLVVDGQDTCRVGFLKKNLVKHAFLYSGKLARITEIYSEDDANSVKKKIYHKNGGCARAELLEWVDLGELHDNDNKDNDDDDDHKNVAGKKRKMESKK